MESKESYHQTFWSLIELFPKDKSAFEAAHFDWEKLPPPQKDLTEALDTIAKHFDLSSDEIRALPSAQSVFWAIIAKDPQLKEKFEKANFDWNKLSVDEGKICHALQKLEDALKWLKLPPVPRPRKVEPSISTDGTPQKASVAEADVGAADTKTAVSRSVGAVLGTLPKPTVAPVEKIPEDELEIISFVDTWNRSGNRYGLVTVCLREERLGAITRIKLDSEHGTYYIFLPRYKTRDKYVKESWERLEKFFDITGKGPYLELVSVAESGNPHADSPDKKKGSIMLKTKP
jgi:hypothetical protein